MGRHLNGSADVAVICIFSRFWSEWEGNGVGVVVAVVRGAKAFPALLPQSAPLAPQRSFTAALRQQFLEGLCRNVVHFSLSLPRNGPTFRGFQ